VRDGDTIEIVIDRNALHGTVDLVGEGEERFSAEEGGRRLAARTPRNDLAPHPALPDDTRLWAALVQASGGVWGGCVYDADAIIARLTGHADSPLNSSLKEGSPDETLPHD
jgi:dihydroxyacid dehydratase/phosphogluconate dehydratase